MTEPEAIKLDKNKIETGVDDECDTNMSIKRARPVEIEEKYEQSKIAPIITQKINKNQLNSPPKMIKLVNANKPEESHAQCKPKQNISIGNKLRIDKIVDNLKINLMQKISETNLPKVAQINKQQQKLEHKVIRTSLTDKRAHELFIKAIEGLNKKQENDEATEASSKSSNELDDDLTNLSWLTKFTLAKDMGLHNHYSFTLSPPPSPISSINSISSSPMSNSSSSSLLSPISPSQPLSINTRVHVVRPMQVHKTGNIAASRTKINPIYLNKSNGMDVGLNAVGDEADGAASLSKTRSNMVQDISHIIKPWIPLTSNEVDVRIRPPYSFSCLTFLAIESSVRKRLSVKEIYTWITENFPYYRGVPSGSWKNSVRHNLSYNQCFSKVDKNMLAMRDFSGKGSLWRINPEFRPLLVESLLKTPTHEQNKLANIPYLQDVIESPKPITSTSLITSSKTKQLCATKTIINPKIISRLESAGTILTSSNSGISKTKNLIHPPITHVRNSLLSSRSASFNFKSAQDQQVGIEICSEMDAVNALLSMKSRASSTPIYVNQRGSLSQQTSSNCLNSSFSSSSNDLTDSNRKSRRKQILRPQKSCFIEQTNDDEYDEDEELNNLIDDEEELDESTERVELNKKHESRKNKRLLVKFPCFNTKKLQSQAVTQIEDEDKDEDEDERSLHIDENFNSETDNITSESHTNRKRKLDENESEESESDSNKSNALLELSRAASLVENQKNEAISSSLSKSNSKKPKQLNESSTTRSTTRSMTNNSNLIEANVVNTRSKSLNLKINKK